MKRLLALTLFALFTISCATRQQAQNGPVTKGATMNHSVATQAEVDAANQRINQFKQELLKQGFREVSSTSFSDSKSNSAEEFVLEGQYGSLTDLRVTLRSTKQLQTEPPPFAGGIEASIKDEKADQQFHELYQRVCTVVTGQSETCVRDGF